MNFEQRKAQGDRLTIAICCEQQGKPFPDMDEQTKAAYDEYMKIWGE